MKIGNVPTVITKNMKDVYLSSLDGERDDYFYIAVANKIYAKLYEHKGEWFIWYTDRGYRRKVPGFTYALNLIEREVAA